MMKKEESVFNKIFENNYKAVYGYLLGKTSNSNIAEEILQETFLRVWQFIDKLSEMKERQQQTWIFKVAKNLLIDYYRKNTTRLNLHQEMKYNSINFSSYTNETLDNFINEYQLQRLEKFIRNLPEKQRIILYMSVIGELSSKEIGIRLNMPAGTVRYQLYLTRQKLKNKLNHNYEEGSD